VHGSERESLAATTHAAVLPPANNLDDPPIRPLGRSGGTGAKKSCFDCLVPDEPTKPYDMHDVIRRV